MLDLKKAAVRWDWEQYIPKKVSGFVSEKLSGTPRRMARAFLKRNGGTIKLSAPVADLKYERTAESLCARAVLFQQHYRRFPVHGAWLTVHIDRKNRVFLLKNETIPVERLKKKFSGKRPKFLPAERMNAIIRREVREHGTLHTRVGRERMIYARKNGLSWALKVRFGTKDPPGSWILFIDRTSGRILEERNIIRKRNGRGTVFIPNPVAALDRDDLSDRKDRDGAVFRKAYRTVVLRDLEDGGRLKGPYADTTRTRRCARSVSGDFRCDRSDYRFEEVMAYYHIDTVQRYIQSLGFTGGAGILDRPVRVNAHGTREDNSYYDPSPGRQDLTFGDGGVDDAEDAEIILHEYGHAIQDAVIPGFGQSHEAAAMGEGFGDYLAASFFASRKPRKRRTKIGQWDVKGARGGGDCLRSLDGKEHYPADMTNEAHKDGRIWSACLWKVRELLGRKKADTVILESHFYLSQYADFRDGAEAIIMAEKNLSGGRRTRGLTRIFREKGIL